ncbi:outer membrane protein OmpA-like peptidoglycan-associated protein [Nocardiopsis mwathae]|uniref:Outer membrane protein OmpA-like peptidoglycan-associated protein n=1 Tax=Nocardiopsis mwathae TaxID=1472723 RepID=A0A7X0D509_9ACTN|nr:OmpA family protein [Nocardiopsis mwathae]MBB6170644.1 outer membrane protein OmpA-like peptidoglycan-associated protein [Nocardiopsis mwathae]
MSIVTSGIMLLTGCSGGGGKEEPDDTPAAEEQTTVTAPDGPFVREGVLGGPAGFRARLEVKAIERRSDRTVVRFLTTPLESGEQTVRGAFGGKSSTPVGFRLLDPAGHRLYYPLVNGNGGGALGTELPTWVVGEVEYVMEAHFPRLPEDIEAITVITPGSTAEMTGIPVEDADEPEDVPSEDPPGYLDLSPGDEVELPVVSGPVKGKPEDRVKTLYSVVQSPKEERDHSGDRERITIPAGDLFIDDEAELKRGADPVLHGLVKEFHDRADPEKPIEITVHTAAGGDAGDNKKLSQSRAKAAKEFLEEGAGDDYEIKATGVGGAEPVADEGGLNVEEARARNHRLEVSFRIKEEEEEEEADQEADDEAPSGEDGGDSASEESDGDEANAEDGDKGEDEAKPVGPALAPFRAKDAEPVRTATGWTRDHDYEMDVLPFYRDGDFLVANMVIRNVSDPEDSAEDAEVSSPFSGEYEGSQFGEFSVIDPETQTVYRELRVGATRAHEKKGGVDFVEPPGDAFYPEPGWEGRVFFYVPAPPEGVTTITFDAGLFGEIKDVPIE